MEKVRIVEIAEEASTTSSVVIEKANELGIKVKSPQSSVDEMQAEEILNYIMTGESKLLKNAKAPKKKPTPKKKTTPKPKQNTEGKKQNKETKDTKVKEPLKQSKPKQKPKKQTQEQEETK
jgi:translation initiation factor IF-2